MNIEGIAGEKQSYLGRFFGGEKTSIWHDPSFYIVGGFSLLMAGSLYYWIRDIVRDASDIRVLKNRVTIDKNRLDLAAVIAIVLCAILTVSLFFVSYPKDIASLLLALAGIGGIPLIIARFVYPKGDQLIDRFI